MKKRCLFRLMTIILTAALLLSTGVVAAAAPAGVQAVPNKAPVQINNSTVSFEAYTIGGNNYFRLRDLAKAFMGSSERFSVEYDGTTDTVRLMSDSLYHPIGGELEVSSSTSPVTAVPTTSQVYLDGKLMYAKGYLIGETNYFKLRDIGAAMTFSVTYDSKTPSLKIDTTKEYYMPALLELLPEATYKEYYTPAQLAGLPNGTPAEGNIFFNGTDSGYITIIEYDRTNFKIICDNLTSDNDLAKLKSVVGVFVSDPEQVMAAAMSSKTEGQKTLQLDNKTMTCMYFGQQITITVKW